MSSPRYRIAAAAVAAAVVALPTLVAPPAGAVAAKCVSTGEYSQIHQGQTMPKMHQVVDQQKVYYGYQAAGGNPAALEQYQTCGWSKKYVTVVYVGGLGAPFTVKSKSLKVFLGSVSRVRR